MPPAPPRSSRLLGASAPRPGGRSARGRPRRGSAGRGRSRRSARRSGPARPRPRRRGRRRRTRPTARPGRAPGVTAPSSRASTRSASGRCSGSSSRTCSAPEPTEALSWPGVPSAITLPWSITAIPSASWSASSRYCVQSRIVVPPATSARMMSQTWLRERGSRPGRRLVEEHQLRRDDDARRDVEPPPHPAGVVLDQAPGRVGEAEGLEQLVGARLGARRASGRAAGRSGSGSRGR